jgi:hypothetical protein
MLVAGVYDTSFTAETVQYHYSGLMEYFSTRAVPVIRGLYPHCSNESIGFQPIPFIYEDDFPYKQTLADVEGGLYDFVFMPTNLAVCTASFGWTHLVTRVKSKLAIDEGSIPVGGIVLTRAGNDMINTFEDLRNKIVVTTWWGIFFHTSARPHLKGSLPGGPGCAQRFRQILTCLACAGLFPQQTSCSQAKCSNSREFSSCRTPNRCEKVFLPTFAHSVCHLAENKRRTQPACQAAKLFVIGNPMASHFHAIGMFLTKAAVISGKR